MLTVGYKKYLKREMYQGEGSRGTCPLHFKGNVMSNKTTTVNSGIGVFSLLGIVFVTLKLLGKITWSWWWVTLPFWGGFALFGIIISVIMLMAAIAVIINGANW